MGGGGISVLCLPPGSGGDRLAWFLARCNFPGESQMNSRRYHLVFLTITPPPDSQAAPDKMFGPSWASLTVSYVGVLGEIATWIIVEPYIKHYSTSL